MKNTKSALLLILELLLQAAARSAEIHHAQGEFAGEVTDSSVVLQSRLTAIPGPGLDAGGDVPGAKGVARFEWSQHQDFRDSRKSDWLHAEPALDFIVRVKVDGLSAGVRYYYRLEYGSDEKAAALGSTCGFRTLAPESTAEPVSFCMGSCMNYYAFMSGNANGGGPVTATDEDKRQGYPVFEAMSALKPDFFIGTGDVVYYDMPNDHPAQSDFELHRKWHEQFRFPRLTNFFRNCPAYWLKDDHDFRFDDADQSGDKAPCAKSGRDLFREQMPIFPAGDLETPTYRTRRVHPNLQLWLMEGRDYRSDNKQPDGPDKSLWGVQQRRWLERTLKESGASWKIIISPTPMVGPDRQNKRDNHADPEGFQNEAEGFFRWLNQEGMGNVLIFCGDRHWQYHSIHPLGIEEFSVGALNDENSIAGVKAGTPASTDPQGLIKQPYLYGEPTGGFLHVTTSGTSGQRNLTLAFHDDHGKLLHQVVRKDP